MTETGPEVASAIEVVELTKEYRNPRGEVFRAVDRITFRALAGRIFGLLGPNGAGKTTTLRMLSTLIAPTSGVARVAGYDVTGDPEAVRRSIGFLTGSTGLYPRLTVREVVRYFGRLYGLETDRLEARLDSVFTELRIEEFQNKRCGDLSTGMKQKVSIARAIIHDPSVLILDEPTTGLDVLASRHLVEFIRGSRDRGRCVLFSTHIMSEAERLCDGLAVIHRGRIVGAGTVAELREQTGRRYVEDVFLALLGEPVEATSPAGEAAP